jgi:putative radical SAM enzyme (TIGR03279 family)
LEVQAKSLAAKAGIKARDEILSINGMPVADFFDLQYYANDFLLDIELRSPSGEVRQTSIERLPGKALGLEPVEYKHKLCKNHCVFCFVDQMPPGMRPSLYRKDDDYLYSHTFGNYITLSNLTPRELKRITDQHISPLYVSLHTTNPALRKQMMGYDRDFDIMKLMAKLSRKGISFHVQFVCVPEYNTGEELRKSLADLARSRINLLSIGVVPVGLTKFRGRLTRLEAIDPDMARDILSICAAARQEHDIVQAADELFLLAGEPIPGLDYYGDFPQLENGIGMLRLTRENFKKKRKALLRELDKAALPFHLLTARSARETIDSLAESMNKGLERSSVQVQSITNKFFGEQVSVSGLLTAKDILEQHKAGQSGAVMLPNNLFNSDCLTLDGISQLGLKERLNRPLLVVDQYFEDWKWI